MDNKAYTNMSKVYQVHKVVSALGKERFGLKGRYVVLAKSPSFGYYIIPVFEGTNPQIHCISCLSKDVRQKAEQGIIKTGAVYRLHVKCRFIISPNSHHKRCENKCEEVLAKYPICRVGEPAEDCWENFAKRFGDWDYRAPECACWDFSEEDEVDLAALELTKPITLEDLVETL